jgi:hypothetical protein
VSLCLPALPVAELVRTSPPSAGRSQPSRVSFGPLLSWPRVTHLPPDGSPAFGGLPVSSPPSEMRRFWRPPEMHRFWRPLEMHRFWRPSIGYLPLVLAGRWSLPRHGLGAPPLFCWPCFVVDFCFSAVKSTSGRHAASPVRPPRSGPTFGPPPWGLYSFFSYLNLGEVFMAKTFTL